MRLLLLFGCLALPLLPATKRVLYVTHSAGFRHDSLPLSARVMDQVARETGKLEVVSTEDLSWITADRLRDFDVVFFYTSGELALSAAQKADLLEFVRQGKGFGGAHSATDTLYSWAEYGDLIGGYFDGHPWAQEASIEVEDPDHPAARHLAPSWRIVEEFYQFREFSRGRVRVLMSLDTRSVDLNRPGVNRTDGDFALAWVRDYGRGRVFYTALGHFAETWQDRRFQISLREALLWLARETEADARPRPSAAPAIRSVTNAASFAPGPQAPGTIVSIFGENLTSGSTLAAASFPLPFKLAGTSVAIGGSAAPLLFVSPGQINAQIPFDAKSGSVEVRNPAAGVREGDLAAASPGIFAVALNPVRRGSVLTIYATGLGAVQPPVIPGEAAPAVPLSSTVVRPVVEIGGRSLDAAFSGLAPGFAGLYQVNANVPADLAAGPAFLVVRASGLESNRISITVAE
ncbi:MAG: ThuA domain-containing protein [Bryobacteraceae bacterium]